MIQIMIISITWDSSISFSVILQSTVCQQLLVQLSQRAEQGQGQQRVNFIATPRRAVTLGVLLELKEVLGSAAAIARLRTNLNDCRGKYPKQVYSVSACLCFHRERCMIYDQQRSNMHTSLWLTCCHRVSSHVTSVGPHVCPHASLLISPGHLSFLPQPSRLPSLLLPSPLFISLCPLLALFFASLFFFPSPPICLTPLSLVE